MDQNTMNINELTVVCQSKKEMYKILQVEGGIYLPPIEQANHKFVTEIVSGEKNVDNLINNLFLVLKEFRYKS